MKRITTLGVFFMSVLCLNLQAQQPDQEAMMKAWQEYMTPGDIH